MNRLPAELVEGLRLLRVTPVAGGDIARAYRLDGPDGPLFIKTHPAPAPKLFEREARGLQALRAAAPPGLRVPEVVRSSPRGLVLEWVDAGQRTSASEAALGAGLAGLHRSSQSHFGGFSGDDFGYLGSVEVDLSPTQSWPEFYVERRLWPLVLRAVRQGSISEQAIALMDSLAARADELSGPAEPPALIHGDLWAGNRLVDLDGVNWLIDPAAHFAHREVDLAMMELFGGFGDAAFAAYHEAYPLAEGWRRRMPWYQLVPLLVHTILFGAGYSASTLSVLQKLSR